MKKQKFKRIPTDRDFRRLLDEMGRHETVPTKQKRKTRNLLLGLLFLAPLAVAAYFYRERLLAELGRLWEYFQTIVAR
ncbi:MAG: hypothetical protein AB1896_11285 [Thermodesulfobacteriota bacterium]